MSFKSGSGQTVTNLHSMLDIKCYYNFEFEKTGYPIDLDVEILPFNYDNDRNLYINIINQFAFNLVEFFK